MNQLVKSTITRPRKVALWIGALVAGACILAVPAVTSAASPELTDACARFVASSPMSALPEDCKGVVSPVVFPSAGSTSVSPLVVVTSDAQTPAGPQVVANADAAFLASPAGQELLALALEMAGGSRHIVVVLTPQLANQIAGGTVVNVATAETGSVTLGQYCQMADGSIVNLLTVAAGGGALLLMQDARGNVTAVDCLLPAATSHTPTSSSPVVTPIASPVTGGPVSAPGRAAY